jgi:hypothetical protein
MTEAEWETSANAYGMFKVAGESYPKFRKSILVTAACLRLPGAIRSSPGPESLLSLERIEEFADLPFGEEHWRRCMSDGFDPPTVDPWLMDPPQRGVSSGYGPCGHGDPAPGFYVSFEVGSGLPEWRADCAGADAAQLIRDVFGNPFRPVAFAPAWRTDTAVALARQMYESRDFGVMPILADALQDAGCDSADVLDHCRGPGPHARKCWVCDLVLGNE